jgi:hypothetical protein
VENIGLFAAIASAAMIITFINSIYTMRNNLKGPQEKRWEELKKWTEKINEQNDRIEERLSRDYDRLNSHAKFLRKRGEFEELVLLSLSGILKHAATGNNTGNMQNLSNRLEAYTLSLGRMNSEQLDDE